MFLPVASLTLVQVWPGSSRPLCLLSHLQLVSCAGYEPVGLFVRLVLKSHQGFLFFTIDLFFFLRATSGTARDTVRAAAG